MSNPNEAVARRWFEEVWNLRRTETIDELLTPDSVCHAEGGEMRGPEAFKAASHTPFLAAMPDLHIEVEATVAEGDQVAVRWLATGTHTGDGFGLPPTGQPVQIRGVTWIRFENGKMMEGWDCWNVTGMMRTLGAPV